MAQSINTANFCAMCGTPHYHGSHWAQDRIDLATIIRSRLKAAEIALHKERNTDKDKVIAELLEANIRLSLEVKNLNNSWLQTKCNSQARAIRHLEEKIKRMKGLPYG